MKIPFRNIYLEKKLVYAWIIDNTLWFCLGVAVGMGIIWELFME